MLDKLEKLIRPYLDKHNVDSVEELKNKFLNKTRKSHTPDDDVKNILAKKELTPRQFEFAGMLDRCRIRDILPVEWFDEETGLYQTERAYGWVFDCGTVVGYQDGLDEQLRGLFSLSLPVNTCMQVLFIASPELESQFLQYHDMHLDELTKNVAKHRTEYYNRGLYQSLRDGYKFPIRDFRLVITFTFDGVYEDELNKVMIQRRQGIESVLQNSYISNKIMQPEALINLYRQLWCISSKGTPRVNYNPHLSIRDQIADIDNNVYISADGMVINDVGVKSIAITNYPEEFRLGQCAKFIGNETSLVEQISYPFILCQNVVFLDASKENIKLNKNAAIVAEQIKPGKFTAMFKTFHKKHHEYQLMQRVVSDGEGMMLMGHSLHVFYPLGESETAFQEIKSLYKTFNWSVAPNSNLQLPSYFCASPLMHDAIAADEQQSLRMLQLYTQTNVTNTMPIFGEYKGTGKKILQFIGACGQIMYYDLFQSTTNYNVAISASSGAGKSFLMNEIIKSYRARDARISVIDVGRSYKDGCSVFGGQYIEFTKEAGICINPFSFIKFKLGLDEKSDLATDEISELADLDFSKINHISREDLLDAEDLDDQIEMVKQIFLISAGFGDGHPELALAKSLFEQAILGSLQKYQTKSTYTTVYDELLIIAEKEAQPFARRLADSIRSYTKEGIYGKFFEGESNLNLDNPYIVLELEELGTKGDLKFIVLMILMLKITQDMYLSSRSIMKLCIIDEAWDLMTGGNTGQFIVTAYRRARKYNGSIQTITQRVDDYEINATTRACYENAAIQMMLKQSVPEKIQLPPYTVSLLRNLDSVPGVYSELIISMNKVTAKCRFIVDDFTQMLYSTNPQDITLLNFVKDKEGLDTAQALERLMQMFNSYKLRYKGTRDQATPQLIDYINQQGYSAMLDALNLGTRQ